MTRCVETRCVVEEPYVPSAYTNYYGARVQVVSTQLVHGSNTN